VFRAFPYLYDGDIAYEQDYLRVYVNAPGAAVIVARDEDAIVGVSTCLPLAAETPNVQQPFRDAGMNVADILYFGESVLAPEYRGHGIGVAFFQAREAQARVLGCPITAFCAVQRPADHKLRPTGYAPLDDFWRKRGYTKREDLVCRMKWRDIGETEETEKTLMFWTKTL
jgi:GNAT superfamily N-acetyltransferase